MILEPVAEQDIVGPPPVPVFVHHIEGELVHRLAAAMTAIGFGHEIEWMEGVKSPEDADVFAREAIWVICCSGMKFAVARLIEGRCLKAIEDGRPVTEVFGHKGKATAIETIWRDREKLYAAFTALPDDEARLAFCRGLPWIGDITKWHLAKNYGLDVAKPDVHLARLAERAGEPVADLCARLAVETGFRRATVDLILWRACASGLLDSRTGALQSSV